MGEESTLWGLVPSSLAGLKMASQRKVFRWQRFYLTGRCTTVNSMDGKRVTKQRWKSFQRVPPSTGKSSRGSLDHSPKTHPTKALLSCRPALPTWVGSRTTCATGKGQKPGPPAPAATPSTKATLATGTMTNGTKKVT